MQLWIAASAAGIVLGLLFFACVRMRMTMGPYLRKRFGNWARQAYWLATILLMILIANAMLQLLRQYAPDQENSFYAELWFISLAAAIAFTLIYRRVNRNR
jgi:hypothetical protein